MKIFEPEAFTDADLKRIKEAPHIADDQDILRLVARLEAAEAHVEFRVRFPAGHDGEAKLLEVWRASKGETE